MPRFILTAYRAERQVIDGIAYYSTRFEIGGAADPFPARSMEARNTAEAMAAFAAYKAEAAGTGLLLACSIKLAKGERAPAGFRQAATSPFDNIVNTEKAA